VRLSSDEEHPRFNCRTDRMIDDRKRRAIVSIKRQQTLMLEP
jgi:hypothetical protein